MWHTWQLFSHCNLHLSLWHSALNLGFLYFFLSHTDLHSNRCHFQNDFTCLSIFALLTMFFMEGLWQFYMLNQNFFLNNIVDGWARWFDSVFVSFFILLVSFFITFSPHVSQWRTLDKISKMRNKLSVTLIYDEKTSSNLQQYLSFV